MSETVANTFDPNNTATKNLISKLTSPWKLKFYFWRKLPSLLYWGVKLKSLSPEKAEVTIPFKKRTQNPFQSIYFASQAGAAEFSTGVLALTAIYGRGNISMLITGMEAEYVKKATRLTTFICKEGKNIQDAVQRAIDSGEPQEITINTTGIQGNGEVVSRFKFRWSFKVRK